MWNWFNGISSLFFIVSTWTALENSKSFCFKCSSVVLVPVSYMCNASGFDPSFLLLDYTAISMVGLSYLNNWGTTVLFTSLAVYEYAKTGTLRKTARATFGTAGAVSLYRTYLYKDAWKGHQLLFSFVLAFFVFLGKVRCSTVQDSMGVRLTYLWHFTCTTILCVAALTV